MKIVSIVLVCPLLAVSVLGQANSQPVTPNSNTTVQELPSPDRSATVAPDAPVITIQGVCDKTATPAPSDCKTVITRAEWEKLVNSLQPNMPKQGQKQLAPRYVQALVLANKAHEMGLDKGPAFEEQMYLSRLQVLARLAGEQIQKDSSKISDAEVEDYYRQHTAEFRTVTYEKIFVPKQKQGTTPSSAAGPDAEKKRQAAEAEMKAEADKLRARAAAGEDFAKLQQEAYDFAGMKLTANNTRVEKVRKNSMLPNDAAIFDLKKGEISQVINDPQAFMIYKVEEFQEQPLSEVKDEVSRAAQQQKLRSASEEVQKSATQNTTYDDAYFASPAPPSLKKPGETAPPAPSAPPGQK